jgi:hypothetical protein
MPSSSLMPSFFPTRAVASKRGRYRQEFIILPVNNITFFNESEIVEIMDLFASYTPNFPIDPPEVVNTTCTFIEQGIFPPEEGSIEITTMLTMDYRCDFYSRNTFNITETYPAMYEAYMDANNASITMDVQMIAPQVVAVGPVLEIQTATPAPTISLGPSSTPTHLPTLTTSPSLLPSELPFPSQRIPSYPPTSSNGPTTLYPTILPSVPSKPTDSNVGLIAGVVIALGMMGMAGLVLFYRQLKQNRALLMAAQAGPMERTNNLKPGGNDVESSFFRGDEHTDAGVMPPRHSGSLISNRSLLSAGESGLGEESGDEMDGTKNLQDEFDQYKDHTLEQFRSNVEGNLTGFEGIMSAAVTKALMGDDDDNVDQSELLWGYDVNPSGAEIEASALCEVNDWIKRNESAPVERKRVFMKEVLNKMVTSVRFGILRADDASRAIHESAALLGLPLANVLPMTTVIVSGMRKTVDASEMTAVFGEFGDIDEAAVASGQRGFGIVRFRSTQSVDRAMRRYRGGEIVVQDVAIQMKVLTPSGQVES